MLPIDIIIKWSSFTGYFLDFYFIVVVVGADAVVDVALASVVVHNSPRARRSWTISCCCALRVEVAAVVVVAAAVVVVAALVVVWVVVQFKKIRKMNCHDEFFSNLTVADTQVC